MNVLVAYASRHGSTAGIAERIAAGLREAGLSAEARDVKRVDNIEAYGAFVVGSAAYMFHWLKDATRFVKRHRAVLEKQPVWLFSSGPLGTDLVDEDGIDVLETTRPKEFAELAPLVHPRGMQVFFGAWDPEAPPAGLVERMVRRMPAADATPAGDFRDWAAIDAWAAGIARELRTTAAVVSRSG
ncbi:MAG TPA: flavodoxin domain-containing protein [Euzebyales bacterium]|nr:flavodoxin domain-containing protein [Euzebyales bacterium]